MGPGSPTPRRTVLARTLAPIERGGNALPHPVTLFALRGLLTIVVSWVASVAGLEARHPGTGEVIRVVNLLSVDGLHRILTEMVDNFTGFAPLGTVLVAMVLLAAFINLFMGSASAKWAIMAPVFVPMFMLLDYSPALIQATYRIGDSTTNVITPVMSFFPLVVVYIERYRKDAGIGTVISTMLPYTVVFLVLWIVLLIGWVLLRLPLGPGAPPFL